MYLYEYLMRHTILISEEFGVYSIINIFFFKFTDFFSAQVVHYLGHQYLKTRE